MSDRLARQDDLEASISSLSFPLKTVWAMGDEAIQSLPTTPVAIVSAPGAGKAIIPISVTLHFKWSGSYTNIAPTALLGTKWQSGPTANYLIGMYEGEGGVTGFLGAGESVMATMGLNAKPVGPAIELGIGTEMLTYPTRTDNSAFYLTMVNAAQGNLTGGHSNNILRITTVYNVIIL